MFKKTLYCLFFLLLPFVTKPFVSCCILEKDGKKIVILGTQKTEQPLEWAQNQLFLQFINNYGRKPNASKITILLNSPSYFTAYESGHSHKPTNLTDLLEKKKYEQPNGKIKIRHFEPRIEKETGAVPTFLRDSIPRIAHMPKDKDFKAILLEINSTYLLDRNVTVGSYLKTLNDWHQRIITKWVPQIKDSQAKAIFAQLVKNFEISLSWAKGQFTSHTDKNLIDTLLSSLQQTKSQEPCLTLLKDYTQYLLCGLDYTYVQLGLIYNTLVQKSKQDIQFIITDQNQCSLLVGFFESHNYDKKTESVTDLKKKQHQITCGFSSHNIKEIHNVLYPNNPYTYKQFRQLHINLNLCVCGNKTNLRKCSNCKKITYCSVACQKKDWKLHKPECKKLSGQE